MALGLFPEAQRTTACALTYVDKRRLRELVVSLAGTAAMASIDEQLRFVLGLEPLDPGWG